MIDPDIFDSIDPETRHHLRAAFAMIADSGLLIHQENRELSRIANGPMDEPLADFHLRVLDYRARVQSLRSLQQFGQSFSRESYDE